jgi:hypothetical protein
MLVFGKWPIFEKKKITSASWANGYIFTGAGGLKAKRLNTMNLPHLTTN